MQDNDLIYDLLDEIRESTKDQTIKNLVYKIMILLDGGEEDIR
jgi:hypothetical protein